MSNQLPVEVFRDAFTDHELAMIWKGIDAYEPAYLLEPDHTGTAKDKDEKALKDNRGVWLPKLTGKNDPSSLQRECIKFITDMKHTMLAKDDFWKYLYYSESSINLLLSYYGNSSYYKPHHDRAVVTILMWFAREPQRFVGGDLKVYNEVIPFANNTVIFLPSMVEHEVTPIAMGNDWEALKGYGRYCISLFTGTP